MNEPAIPPRLHISHDTVVSLGLFFSFAVVFGTGLYWAGRSDTRLESVENELKKINAVELERRLTRMEAKLDRAVTLRTTTTPETWPLSLLSGSKQWSENPAWIAAPWTTTP